MAIPYDGRPSAQRAYIENGSARLEAHSLSRALLPVTPEAYGFDVLRAGISPSLDSEVSIWRSRLTGTTVIVISNEDPDMHLQVAVPTWPEDNRGTPHVVEHVVVNGALDQRSHLPSIGGLGGNMPAYFNAVTRQLFTVYRAASSDLETLLTLSARNCRCVLHAAFLEADFLNHRGYFHRSTGADTFRFSGILCTEMLAGYTADRITDNVLRRALFQTGPFGFDPAGDPLEVHGLEYAEALDFYRRHYTPGRMLIVAYGNIPKPELIHFLHRQLEGEAETYCPPSVPEAAQASGPRAVEIPYPVIPGTSEEIDQLHQYIFAARFDRSGDPVVRLKQSLLLTALQDETQGPIAAAHRRLGAPGKFREVSLKHFGTQSVLAIKFDDLRSGESQILRGMLEETLRELAATGVKRALVEENLDRRLNPMKSSVHGAGFLICDRIIEEYFSGSSLLHGPSAKQVAREVHGELKKIGPRPVLGEELTALCIDNLDIHHVMLRPDSTLLPARNAAWQAKACVSVRGLSAEECAELDTIATAVKEAVPPFFLEPFLPPPVIPDARGISPVTVHEQEQDGARILTCLHPRVTQSAASLVYQVPTVDPYHLATLRLALSEMGWLCLESVSSRTLASLLREKGASLTPRLEVFSEYAPGVGTPAIIIEVETASETVREVCSLFQEALETGRFTNRDHVLSELKLDLHRFSSKRDDPFSVEEAVSLFLNRDGTLEGELRFCAEAASVNREVNARLLRSAEGDWPEFARVLKKTLNAAFGGGCLRIASAAGSPGGAVGLVDVAVMLQALEFPQELTQEFGGWGPQVAPRKQYMFVPTHSQASYLGCAIDVRSMDSDLRGAACIVEALLERYLEHHARSVWHAYGSKVVYSPDQGKFLFHTLRDPDPYRSLEKLQSLPGAVGGLLDGLELNALKAAVLPANTEDQDPFMDCRIELYRAVQKRTDRFDQQHRDEILNTTSADLSAFCDFLADRFHRYESAIVIGGQAEPPSGCDLPFELGTIEDDL